jgi:phosphoserine aminotransferase
MTTQPKRVHNFNAGPAGLPLEVLQQAQAELLDFKGTGMSVMEISHRSKEFEGVIHEAEADMRELLSIPTNYKVLFLQGGATLQFAMAAMNFRAPGASADYIVTGAWAKKALEEAQKLGATSVAASSKATNFDRIPTQAELKLDPKAAYLHITANETIQGIEYKTEPVAPAGVPLFCDASSDFLSRPIDVAKYGLIYAGAQKNIGPAGVVAVILRDDLLERVPANLPAMLDYKLMAADGSLYNTPPCFSIYMVGLVMKWIKGLGGAAAIAKINQAKATLIYKTIDESGGYYRGHAQVADRSTMNVTFRLPAEALEDQFAKEANKAGLVGLKGHRSVGGMRASIYNAMPVEGVMTLVEYMKEFEVKHG